MRAEEVLKKLFQFLIGRLATERQEGVWSYLKEFQFLIGRLATIFTKGKYSLSNMFQFLIGRLATFSQSPNPRIVPLVSIPYR